MVVQLSSVIVCEIDAVGDEFTVTTIALDVTEHELELVTTTVYEPAAVAV